MGSHTLVVHREQAAPYRGGREPFLQRWLFSPRLAIIALVVVLGVGLGLGGWWFTSGRYTQVPSVTGDSVAAATTALTTHGFKVTQGARVHSNAVPEGTVMGTNPSGRVAKGSTDRDPHLGRAVHLGGAEGAGRHAQRRRGRAAAGAPELQRAEVRLGRPGRDRAGHQPGSGHDLAADQAGGHPGLRGRVGAELRRDDPAGRPAVGGPARRQPATAAGSAEPAAAGHDHRSAAGARIAVYTGRDHYGPGGLRSPPRSPSPTRTA